MQEENPKPTAAAPLLDQKKSLQIFMFQECFIRQNRLEKNEEG